MDIQRIADALAVVTDVFKRIPDDGGLQLSTGGGTGMSFHTGYPMSVCAIAENDTEVNELKSSTNRVLDARDMTVWHNDGGVWTSHLYSGDQSFLRPKTLCYSPPNQRVYYCDGFLRLTRASLTTAPTVN